MLFEEGEMRGPRRQAQVDMVGLIQAKGDEEHERPRLRGANAQLVPKPAPPVNSARIGLRLLAKVLGTARQARLAGA
jgi:hypothetical protein